MSQVSMIAVRALAAAVEGASVARERFWLARVFMEGPQLEPAAFSRAFRRWTGTAPSAYRADP